MAMKHYSPEFKADAVALYRSRPGVTVAAVARDLGVNTETLRSWIRNEDRQHGRSSAPASNQPAAASVPGTVEAENALLRKKVRELEKEREILRKAAKYFAGETRW
jgi:transposase